MFFIVSEESSIFSSTEIISPFESDEEEIKTDEFSFGSPAPPIPLTDDDQWEGSDQLPDPPIQ